jgi:hypothetical protein
MLVLARRFLMPPIDMMNIGLATKDLISFVGGED